MIKFEFSPTTIPEVRILEKCVKDLADLAEARNAEIVAAREADAAAAEGFKPTLVPSAAEAAEAARVAEDSPPLPTGPETPPTDPPEETMSTRTGPPQDGDGVFIDTSTGLPEDPQPGEEPTFWQKEVGEIPGITSRVRNGLQRNHVHTVGKLVRCTEAFVNSIDGVGPTTLKHLAEFLAQFGYSWATEGGPSPVSKLEAPPVEKVRDALMAVSTEISLPAAQQMIESYGTSTVSGVAVERRAEFIAECEAKLADARVNQ